MENSILIGTISKSVAHIPIIICQKLRPVLYDILGLPWPYKYDNHSDKFHLQTEKSLAEYSNFEIRHLSFIKGPCIPDNKKSVPVVTHRFNKKTSQGKVVMTKTLIEDANIVAIVKCNQITDRHKTLWISDYQTPELKSKDGNIHIISKSFMDALCSVLLSRLVEKQISPHFPLCYATSVNRIHFKRMRRDDDESSGTLCQTIWMEFLSSSMYEVLSKTEDDVLWYSAIFQIACGLASAQACYSFIHNDCHSENVRVRLVPKYTILYYEIDGIPAAVPTLGFVFVLIDFGRATVKPWGSKDSETYASSVYHSKGECAGFVCNNPSFDMVRLITSLADTITVVKDVNKQERLRKFMISSCQTDDGRNIFKEALASDSMKLNQILEAIPRKSCHESQPRKIIQGLIDMYRIPSFPEGIRPFVIK